MKRLLDRLRRRARVDITCPHGVFIPGAYRLGDQRRYGCQKCGFTVRLTTFRGDITW